MEVSKERVAQKKYKKDEAHKISKEEHRHEQFQFGTDPMKMTSFEKMLAKKEAYEREKARVDYVLGVQGRDGGCTGSEHEEEYDDLY